MVGRAKPAAPGGGHGLVSTFVAAREELERAYGFVQPPENDKALDESPHELPASAVDQEAAERFCSLIEDDADVELIARKTGSVPTFRTFYRWLEQDPALRRRYARARLVQAAHIVASMRRIEVDTVLRRMDPNAARVVLQSRQWRAGRLDPAQWGERQSLDINAKVAGNVTYSARMPPRVGASPADVPRVLDAPESGIGEADIASAVARGGRGAQDVSDAVLVRRHHADTEHDGLPELDSAG